MLVLASILIMGSVLWALYGLAAIGSDLCEASDPLRLDECNGQLGGEVTRSALSVAFGCGAIVLLIGGLISSPLVHLIG